MCGTPTVFVKNSSLFVKNTFFCVAEDSSPCPQQRARAKTAGAPTAFSDWASDLDTGADTSEGTSDSSSSLGFAFDEEESSQLVKLLHDAVPRIVKNTFICVDEARSPARPQRARAKTAQAATTWEDEVEAAREEVDDGEASMRHMATQWSFGDLLGGRAGSGAAVVEEEEEACDELDDDGAPMLHVATQWSFGSGRAGGAPRMDTQAPSPVLDLDDEEACELARSTFENQGAVERQVLIAALQGRVREAARSPYAYKVLEAAVLYTGTDEAAFIADELLGYGHEDLLDSSTCSVMCCLLEHSPADPRTVALVDELLSGDVAALCSHKSGHTVAAAIISSGIPRQAAQVVLALHTNPQRFARHRFASKVVEVTVRSWMTVGVDSFARALIAQPGTIVSLACHNFGVHVVRALLASPMHTNQVLHFLLKTVRRLSKDKYGRELLRELGVLPDAAAVQ